MITARIYFWFRGALDKKNRTGNTVDLEIDIEESDKEDGDYVKNRADDALSDAVNHGMIDHCCDAGVSDFGIEKLSFSKHRKAADFKL